MENVGFLHTSQTRGGGWCGLEISYASSLSVRSAIKTLGFITNLTIYFTIVTFIIIVDKILKYHGLSFL